MKPLTYRLDAIGYIKGLGQMFEKPKPLTLKNGPKTVLELFT